MTVVRGTHKASKFAPKDVISSMPDNVITHILDRLPIQDAVRTGILSTNWRFKWTSLTQLVFDENFFEYLETKKCNGKIISRLLLYFKGYITKCVLYILDHHILDVEDINHWILSLSGKGLKELTLINMSIYPLMLPTQLSACEELKHLKLRSCFFCLLSRFCGFPNLLSLDMDRVTFQSYTCGEFITRCPSLETLIINYHRPTGELKLNGIAKLKNLKVFSFSLCLLENITMAASSSIFKLMGHLPKLEELNEDFESFKFLEDAGARKRVHTDFLCLKTLTLDQIDFTSDIMVSFVFEMICGSPHLQTLKIIATYKDDVRCTALCCSDLDSNTMGFLQLRTMEFTCYRGSENEVFLIKSLLACSPFLKNIDIYAKSSIAFGGDKGKLKFATKLLKLNRASPLAKVDIYWF